MSPLIYATFKLVHLLSVIVWVGGLAFSHLFLRPALSELDPPVKARLMLAVLSRFLNAALVLGTLTVLSGGALMGSMAKHAIKGAGPLMPWEYLLMAVLGVAMWLALGHVRFVLYKRLQRAVQGLDWSVANATLGSIRQWVLFNLCLGLVIITAVVIGRSI